MPYDTTQVSCDCGEVAAEYHASLKAEDLQGREATCAHCGQHGTIVVCDDEGSVWLEFRPLTQAQALDRFERKALHGRTYISRARAYLEDGVLPPGLR